ncbi:MAG: 23S rRNA (pseudouridine(1915)-N(3))-methyltransferase RlmH [Candidatus Endonucleobacter bathymodioli]|uniref:Ribosomal RNA large subunit methyltransferase H n=1 Tax=Candidatus Endonucleibacter bathymodioli TaxID=539814 RepID=A0AA90NMW3_9GAMM|nr:23S rRNA (pseudouridine(1915)-N(3))-methyltransferase RlmH [Candidatus Endonucleobacter bathymodioli]
MRITLISIGSRMPAWIEDGFREYSRRLVQDVRLELVEVPLGRRHKDTDISRQQTKEATQMLAAIGKGDLVIAMDVIGKLWSTKQLADKMTGWLRSGCDISLLVGGPEGLPRGSDDNVDFRWSLSPLTLPHTLVRIVIAEQIYRAWSILHGHPYHK